jgi:hypothetical protein
VRQPHGDPLDLERGDAELWAETERICRADPTFEPAFDPTFDPTFEPGAEWAAKFEARQRALQAAGG